MMDEDKFQLIVILMISVILLITATTGVSLKKQASLLQIQASECPAIIDAIYEQCTEESNISITTMKGHNVKLTSEHGWCVIR